MNRISEEKEYWDKAALDPDVDKKYICDIKTELFESILKEFKGRTLEIGCGVGRLLRKGFYGIDISQNMINEASRRLHDVYLKKNDGRNIPFDDNFFDNVYCFLVFQHLNLDGVESYIKEAHRVLKSGGTFIFQYIRGDEREKFSNHFNWDKELLPLLKDRFIATGAVDGYIHDQWSLIICKKI